MEINVKEKMKLVEIWLTHEDQENQQTLETLDTLMQEYKKNKYKTVIFYSGNKDLLACTEGLLKNNI